MSSPADNGRGSPERDNRLKNVDVSRFDRPVKSSPEIAVWIKYTLVMRNLYIVRPERLQAQIVDKIIACGRRQPEEPASIFSSAASLRGMRSCTVRWLSEPWLESMLWSFVQEANANDFQLAVHRQAEMQLVEYRSEHLAHYDWHHDVQWHGASGRDRKVSITVQLSDANAYEGGDFEFDEVKTNADFRSKGTVLLFPSYLRHRICPVTKGTRRALVAWFSGPCWT